MAPPSYLVCATERSGSTLLCELLAGTGVAGRPEEFFEFLSATGRLRQPREYFADDADPAILELLPPPLEPPAPPVPWEQRLADARERGTHAQRRLRREDDVGLPRATSSPTASPRTQLGPLRWVHVERARHARAGDLAVARRPDRAVARRGPRRRTASRSSTRARSRTSSAGSRSTPPRGAPGSPSAASSRSRSSTRRSPRDPHATICRGARAHRRPDATCTIPEPPMRRQSDAPLAGVGRPLPRGGPGMTATDHRPPPLAAARARGRGRRTSCARSPPSSSGPCCCSPAARTRSCCCGSPRRRSGPGAFPFPVMHVDTGHNFPEVLEFRDRRVRELGERLIVASVQESIDTGRVAEETGPDARATGCRPTTLLDAIAAHNFDAAFGGARRDEERARAKERIFSFRDEHGQWDPRAPAARGLERLQRRGRARRARARVPALQLDRARRLALHRRGGARDPEHLLRPRARGVRARRDAARRLRVAASRATARRSRRSPCATARSAT